MMWVLYFALRPLAHFFTSIYALRALLTSLGPLIGAELELGHAVAEGWAADVPKDKLENWREDALELKQQLEEIILETFAETYYSMMRRVNYCINFYS